ncbi:MAG: hypothetical protein R3F14_23945 [Polyangiaceae bacterium]
MRDPGDRAELHGDDRGGPGCAAGASVTFAATPALPGNVAFLSQSGALGGDPGAGEVAGAGRLSAFVSLGNGVDVSVNDLIKHWAEDPATDVMLMYIESFGELAEVPGDRGGGAEEADPGGEVRADGGGRGRRRRTRGRWLRGTWQQMRCSRRLASFGLGMMELFGTLAAGVRFAASPEGEKGGGGDERGGAGDLATTCWRAGTCTAR